MNHFNQIQKDRLIVERRLEYWARRFAKVSDGLKNTVDNKVYEIIVSIPSQLPDIQRHIERYNRLKRGYERVEKWKGEYNL